MNKLEKENLFIEINDNKFLVAIGEYDEELNFKITDRETFSPSGFKNGRMINLEASVNNLKKAINKIEERSKVFFSSVNVIINQNDFDCINVNGFKKLNGNQILSEDISYILNDVKTKLVDSEKSKMKRRQSFSGMIMRKYSNFEHEHYQQAFKKLKIKFDS